MLRKIGFLVEIYLEGNAGVELNPSDSKQFWKAFSWPARLKVCGLDPIISPFQALEPLSGCAFTTNSAGGSPCLFHVHPAPFTWERWGRKL